MPLTTAGPAPAGIYWCAAIYTSLTLGASAQMTIQTIQNRRFDLSVTPQIGMLPPQTFAMRVSASIGMQVGTEETTAFGLVVTPGLDMSQIQSVAFGLTVTASIEPSGQPKPGLPAPQVNVAVTRASTI